MPTTASLLEKHELEKFPTKDIFMTKADREIVSRENEIY